jgi:hypothetical protein
MPRIPKRLFGPAALTNAAATKYTVPANTKTIIRQIHLQNPSGAAVPVTVSIGADAAATRILDAYSLAAAAVGEPDSVYDPPCYYVLEAGEVIQAFAGTTAVIVMTINGDECVLG